MAHFRGNGTINRSTQTRDAKNLAMYKSVYGHPPMTSSCLAPGKLNWTDWQTRMVQRLEQKYSSGTDYNTYVKNRECRYNPITCLQQPINTSFSPRRSGHPFPSSFPTRPSNGAEIPESNQFQNPPMHSGSGYFVPSVAPPAPVHVPCPVPALTYAPVDGVRRPPFETRTVSRLSYVPMPYTRQRPMRPPEMRPPEMRPLGMSGPSTESGQSVYRRSYMPVVDLNSCRRVPVRHTDNLPLTPVPETPVRRRRKPEMSPDSTGVACLCFNRSGILPTRPP